MAIDIATTMARLGKIGKVAYVLNQDQAALAPALTALSNLYQSTTDRDLISSLDASQDSTVRSQVSLMPTLASLAQTTLLRAVAADAPAAARTLADAVAEFRRQMILAGSTVKTNTPSVSSAQLSGFVGSGVLVASTKRGDGLVNELAIPEVARLTCQGDSYAGTGTLGKEPFRFVGEPNAAGVWDYDWPQGSAAAADLSAIDSTEDAGTNLLTNGDCETWSGSPLAMTGWNIRVGVYATDLVRQATPYRGTYSAKFVAGSTLTSIDQIFGTDTAATLSPQTSYALNFFLRTVSGTASGGVLTVDLVSDPAGSATVINDQQGTPNSFSVALSTLTTSWSNASGVFRMPAVLPSTYAVRFRITTPLAGADVLVDSRAMGALAAAYPGGPGLAVFSGATPFLTGDAWAVTVANDRGGASYLASFQPLWDRLFGMRGLVSQVGQLLPSSASPTYPDTLIQT